MTRLYCLVEPQAVAEEAREKEAASGRRGSPQSQQRFWSSSHHPQDIFQPWPPRTLGSTAQGDKWLTAEVGLSTCNCKSDCFWVSL